MSEILLLIKNVVGPIFGVLGFVVSVVSCGVAIFVYKHAHLRDVKVYVGNSIDLVDAETFEEHDLEVLFQGKPVKKPRLTSIRVINRGRVHITKEDYDKQLKVYFGPDSQVISAKSIYASPETVSMSLRWRDDDPSRLELEQILLNSGDLIDIAVLVASSSGAFPEGRIVGVKTIHPKEYITFGLGSLGIRKNRTRPGMRGFNKF